MYLYAVVAAQFHGERYLSNGGEQAYRFAVVRVPSRVVLYPCRYDFAGNLANVWRTMLSVGFRSVLVFVRDPVYVYVLWKFKTLGKRRNGEKGSFGVNNFF
mgnify:CR=1 FL=1